MNVDESVLQDCRYLSSAVSTKSNVRKHRPEMVNKNPMVDLDQCVISSSRIGEHPTVSSFNGELLDDWNTIVGPCTLLQPAFLLVDLQCTLLIEQKLKTINDWKTIRYSAAYSAARSRSC